MGVGGLELIFGVCEKRFEIVVSGWDAIDQVPEDEGELVQEVLRFFRDGEYAIVDGCQVQLLEDVGHILFFFGSCVADQLDT